MSLPDSAEYWDDVKRNTKRPEVKHYRPLDQANALCGADVGTPNPKFVNCQDCKNILNPLKHNEKGMGR